MIPPLPELTRLVAAIRDLQGVPRPVNGRSALVNHSAWYEYATPVLQALIAAGIAVERAPSPPPPEQLVGLQRAIDSGRLDRPFDGANWAFRYIGYEYGYLYGGTSWMSLSTWMSAGRFLEELGDRAGAERWTDLSYLEEQMLAWSNDLYEPVEAPEGMPRRHWWWFSASPPDATEAPQAG